MLRACGPVLRHISIHALREEGDLFELHHHGGQTISIHALREEGDCRCAQTACGCLGISIHALREEGDRANPLLVATRTIFLSTPSARRATP